MSEELFVCIDNVTNIIELQGVYLLDLHLYVAEGHISWFVKGLKSTFQRFLTTRKNVVPMQSNLGIFLQCETDPFGLRTEI